MPWWYKNKKLAEDVAKQMNERIGEKRYFVSGSNSKNFGKIYFVHTKQKNKSRKGWFRESQRHRIARLKSLGGKWRFYYKEQKKSKWKKGSLFSLKPTKKTISFLSSQNYKIKFVREK